MTAPLILFGGTFDPPHVRHVQLAEKALSVLHADEVLFMPARVNPQRADQPPSRGADRLAMVVVAIAGRRGLRVCDLELKRDGASYTVDTLRALRAHGEQRPIRLLIGSDQALNLHTWREPEAILEMATPSIVLRPPHTRDAFMRAIEQRGEERMRAWLLPIEPVDCSSTEIRRRLAARECVDDLLDPAVIRYIAEHGLYAPRAQSSAQS